MQTYSVACCSVVNIWCPCRHKKSDVWVRPHKATKDPSTLTYGESIILALTKWAVRTECTAAQSSTDVSSRRAAIVSVSQIFFFFRESGRKRHWQSTVNNLNDIQHMSSRADPAQRTAQLLLFNSQAKELSYHFSFLLSLACESSRNLQKAVFNTIYWGETITVLNFFLAT